jgi:hypothetical protein
MAQRGRRSAASLALATVSPIETVQRQRPPHDLTDEEVEVWVSVVEDQAADWFSPSTAPVLAGYCRHAIAARRVAELIARAVDDLDGEGKPTLTVKDYDRLLKMQERESRAIASLATKMRISQQATTNHRGNKKQIAPRKPWEG